MLLALYLLSVTLLAALPLRYGALGVLSSAIMLSLGLGVAAVIAAVLIVCKYFEKVSTPVLISLSCVLLVGCSLQLLT